MSEPTVFIGIDPGYTGAIAVLTPADIRVFDMPAKGVPGEWHAALKHTVRVAAFYATQNANGVPVRVYIEQVHSMPNQSSVSTFTFGAVFGATVQALVEHFLYSRVHFVAPSVWQPALKLSAKTPDGSRIRASELYPGHADKWPFRKHHGRTDAVLIATYGAMQSALKKETVK